MSSNRAIDTFAGAAGFDWAIHQYDTAGADDDMSINNNRIGPPGRGQPRPLAGDRGRLRLRRSTTSSAATTPSPAPSEAPDLIGCDVLDQAGIDRIAGLAAAAAAADQPARSVVAQSRDRVLPARRPDSGARATSCSAAPAATRSKVVAATTSSTATSTSASGSVSAPTLPTRPPRSARTDLMEKVATSGNFGPGTTGMTLQAGGVRRSRRPGQPRGRPRDPGTAPVDTDTAVFSDFAGELHRHHHRRHRSDGLAGRVTTVVHNNGGVDGTDTIRNIEILQFMTDRPGRTGRGAVDQRIHRRHREGDPERLLTLV